MPESTSSWTVSILPWFLALVLTGFGSAGLWVATGLRDDNRESRQNLNGVYQTINILKEGIFVNTEAINSLRTRLRELEEKTRQYHPDQDYYKPELRHYEGKKQHNHKPRYNSY